jgi:hypothetical protein
MRNYRVTFYKLEKENDEKGKSFVKDSKYLGSVVVDDSGTGTNLTLTAKAFRQASEICQIADKVRIEQL